MREFFRGWRRKAGIVTLVVACVAMGGWVRSVHFYNQIHFPVGAQTTASVVSVNQFAGVELRFTESIPSYWDFYECKAEDTLPLSSTNEDKAQNPLGYASNLVWTSEFRGFGLGGNFDELPTFWLMKSMIPYWSIVDLLTLLSAFLLLSEPRSSTAKNIAEPTSVEGRATS